MTCRTGIGYDIHRLVEGRQLWLGGVSIPYIKGLLGHSDGDALLHAICDALLGAAGEGDIGERFPDTDPKYHNIASSVLLGDVAAALRKKGFSIVNIDAVVIAEQPILAPFKKDMRRVIAELLNIQEDRVCVKAKTSEGLGEIGRREAIAAYAVASIQQGEAV